MSEAPDREMRCEKCDRLLPGVEVVDGPLCAVHPGRIKRRPEQDFPGYFGGQYECPYCGATYELLLMPWAGDPSPLTALYRLTILTDLPDTKSGGEQGRSEE